MYCFYFFIFSIFYSSILRKNYSSINLNWCQFSWKSPEMSRINPFMKTFRNFSLFRSKKVDFWILQFRPHVGMDPCVFHTYTQKLAYCCQKWDRYGPKCMIPVFWKLREFGTTHFSKTGIERTVLTPSTISCKVRPYFLIIFAVKSIKLKIVFFSKTTFFLLTPKLLISRKNLTSDRNYIIWRRTFLCLRFPNNCVFYPLNSIFKIFIYFNFFKNSQFSQKPLDSFTGDPSHRFNRPILRYMSKFKKNPVDSFYIKSPQYY